MTVSARSVALQGVGFGARHLALQGLVAVHEVAIPVGHGGAGGRISVDSGAQLRRRHADDEDLMLSLLLLPAIPGLMRRH